MGEDGARPAETFLDLLACRPAFARMAMVKAPATGERGTELYASGKRDVQALLDRGRDDPMEDPGIPSSAGRAALAAAESLIVGKIFAGNTDRLRELLPTSSTSPPSLPRPGRGTPPIPGGREIAAR